MKMTVGDPQEGGICQKGFRQLRTEFLGGDVATGWHGEQCLELVQGNSECPAKSQGGEEGMLFTGAGTRNRCLKDSWRQNSPEVRSTGFPSSGLWLPSLLCCFEPLGRAWSRATAGSRVPAFEQARHHHFPNKR